MFEFKKVDHDDPLLDEIYRLRYQVYCVEWGFERPGDYDGEKEQDDFDEHAVHFAAIRKDSGALIGTIRLVLDSEIGFPIEKHCLIDADMSHVNRKTLGEISRLAVSKEYRRRATDQLVYQAQDMTEVAAHQVASERRQADNDIVVGLYRKICQESLERPLTHLYAVMARGLFVLLKRIGIVFKPAGPETEYHGLRTPYLGSTEEIVNTLAAVNPEIYADFMVNSNKRSLT